ncbi:MAG TPA: glycosyltransferase family 39 protein, partial [Dehalococcoidia bacterium]|nr:glycosyltransferase family 39 protein [Dehalococcoidia bacterium]
MGVHASLIINEPSMRRFDEALVWYGFALLALTVFAWDAKPSLPRDGWRHSFASFWSSHWIEVVVFALVLAFAFFMRAYKIGTFPPNNGLAFEEALNGNVAFRILHGQRPLMYPVRYLDAVGFWLFGETTFGLRFFGVAMSIATVPVFYLLLRQLVRVPVALFGTALLAAAYWPSLINRETSATTFVTMLLASLLIRGLRNHRALMFLGVGFLAGLISYEYEDIKPVPFYVLGFLGAIAVWQIGGAALKGWRPARDATASILRKAWRPALAFAIAGGIVAGPLIVGTHLGKDPYLGSLHRQEADRRN